MTIFLIGANGQIGQAIKRVLMANQREFYACDREELDITDAQSTANFFNTKQFSCVINCAGFTRVDQAEQETDLAFAVNRDGIENLAVNCKAHQLPLIHLSTDYIFDGKAIQPYSIDAQPNPLNIYGKSKLAGEKILQSMWEKHIIIRTSWVFSAYGENFVKKMLQLGQSRESLSIVADQVGCPTPATELAQFLVTVADCVVTRHFSAWGIYHYCGLPAVSWYEFARVIFEFAKKITPLKLKELSPISAEHYHVPAKRPLYSVLDTTKTCDTFKVKPCDWRIALKQLLPELLY